MAAPRPLDFLTGRKPTRRQAEQPLISSAPLDAEPDPQIVESTLEYDDPEPSEAIAAPQVPVLADPSDPKNLQKNLAAAANYGNEVDRFDARVMLSKKRQRDQQMRAQQRAAAASERETRKQQNIQREEEFRSKGVRFFTDAHGDLKPERDEEGNPRFFAKTYPVEYDKTTGEAIQRKRDESGAVTTSELDANAPIGPAPNRPHELYRQDKKTGWNYLGTVEEGLKSSDERIRSAAASAQGGLEKDFGDVANQALSMRAADVAVRKGEIAAKQEAYRKQTAEMSARIEALKADPKFSEKEGGLFGQVMRRPTAGALQLQAEAKKLEDEMAALPAPEDPETLKPEEEAAKTDLLTWKALVTQTGSVEAAAQRRREMIAERGGDPETDPVNVAIRKRRQQLGMPERGTVEQNANDDRLRQDPRFARQMAARDAVREEFEAAKAKLQERHNALPPDAPERAQLEEESRALLADANARAQQADAALQETQAQVKAEHLGRLREDPDLAPIADELEAVDREPDREKAAGLQKAAQARLEVAVQKKSERLSTEASDALQRIAKIGKAHGPLETIEELKRFPGISEEARTFASQAVEKQAIERLQRVHPELTTEAAKRALYDSSPDTLAEKIGLFADWAANAARTIGSTFVDRMAGITAQSQRFAFLAPTPNRLIQDAVMRVMGAPGGLRGVERSVAKGVDQWRESFEAGRRSDPRFENSNPVNRYVLPAASEFAPNLLGVLTGPFNPGYNALQLLDEGHSQARRDPRLTEEQQETAAIAYAVLGFGPEMLGDYMTAGAINTRMLPKGMRSEVMKRVGTFIDGLGKGGAIYDALPPLLKRTLALGGAGFVEGATENVQDKILGATIETIATGSVREGLKGALEYGRQDLDTFIIAALSGTAMKTVETIYRVTQKGDPAAIEEALTRVEALNSVFQPETVGEMGAITPEAANLGARDVTQEVADLDEQITATRARVGRINVNDELALAENKKRLTGLLGQRLGLVQEAIRNHALNEASAEIDGLVIDGADPDTIALTQNVARALVKVAGGMPLERLTAAERTALETPADDGLPRIEQLKGGVVITDATMERMRELLPVTARLMPGTESEQRETVVGQETAKQEQSSPQKGESSQQTTPELPTFEVTVDGETAPRIVQAEDEGAARDIVAADPKTKGMVRQVLQTSAPTPPAAAAPVAQPPPLPRDADEETFFQAAKADLEREVGKTLPAKAEKALREAVRRVQPQVKRWADAFDSVGWTIAFKDASGNRSDTAGAALDPNNNRLMFSLSDMVRERESMEGGAAQHIVTEEAVHAVSEKLHQEGTINLDRIWTALPEAIKAHTREAYASGDDFTHSREFWRMYIQGRINVGAEGWQVDGKPLVTEQASPSLLKLIRTALVELFKVFRDLRGELAKAGVDSETIAEIEQAAEITLSRIKEVDALQRGASGSSTANAQSTVQEAAAPAGEQGGSSGAAEPRGGSEQTRRVDPTPEPRVERAAEPAANDGGGWTAEERAELAKKLGVPEGAIGRKSKLAQNGMTVDVAFVAQPAADARPSHDAQGVATPGYPQELQPRDRSLPEYRKQVQNIANDLDFSRASFFPETDTPATTADLGAPVMTLDGHTLIGNGREIAIREAYAKGGLPGRKYKQAFAQKAASFGIDQSAVVGMTSPVLKRVIVTPLGTPALVRLSQESNVGASMGSNSMELAGQDAGRITPTLLGLFNPEFALDAKRNEAFLSAYVQQAILGRKPGAETNANEANLSKSEIVRRARAGLFAYAYGLDAEGRAALDRLSGDANDGARKISSALLTVAPLVGRMRADIARGDLFPMDIAAALGRAAQDIAVTLRDAPAGTNAEAALTDLTAQQTFDRSPIETEALRFLVQNRGNRGAIEEGISNYVETVYLAGDPKESDMFGERTAPDVMDAFRRATDPGRIQAREEKHRLAAQALKPRLAAQPSRRDDQTLSLFDDYAQSLPAAAKLNPATFRRTVEKELPEATAADIGDLFQYAQRAVEPQESAETRDNEPSVSPSSDNGAEQAPKRSAWVSTGTPAELVKENLARAEGMALRYSNIPGVEMDDVQQHARIALARAARNFDPAKQEDFGRFAAMAIRNELRTFYRDRKRDRNDPTLDEPAFNDGETEETGRTILQDESADVDAEVSRNETVRLINEVLSELPERMQVALRGKMAGKTYDEIGEEIGTVKQGVDRIISEGMRRLQGKLGERGVRSPRDLIRSQSAPVDPLDELMRRLDMDVIEEISERADREQPGAFETGRPDLALGASNTEVRAVDHYRTLTGAPETHAQWEAEAQAMLERDYEGTVQRLVTAALTPGGQLNAAETKAAQMIIVQESRQTMNPERRRRVQALVWAHRQTGTEQARALGARRDLEQTPEERHRLFLAKVLYTPPAKIRKEIEAATEPTEKQRLLDADAERLRRIEAELKKMGVTLEDIFAGEIMLGLKGSTFLKNRVQSLDEREAAAIKILQGGAVDLATAAKQTGYPADKLQQLYTAFREKMKADLREKVQRGGLTVKQVDLFDAEANGAEASPILAAQAPPLSDAETDAELEKILGAMGFPKPENLGKFKTVKRRRKKLFVPPPAPYDGPVPSDRPIGTMPDAQADLLNPDRNLTRRPTGVAPTGSMDGEQVEIDGVRGITNTNRMPTGVLPVGNTDGTQLENFSDLSNADRMPTGIAPIGSTDGRQGSLDLPYEEWMFRTELTDDAKVARIARMAQAVEGNGFDMLYEAWINSILSGPQTHVVNIAGNALSAAWDMSVQRGSEALLNLVYRDADAASFGEFKYLIRGLAPGFSRGLRLAAKAWSAEADFFRSDVLDQQVELFQEYDKGGGVKPSIPGATGRVVRMPGRALLFMDSFFKGLLGQMEAGVQAYRIARREGLKGDALSRRVNALVNTPGSEAWEKAVEKATELTFQQDLKTTSEGANPVENLASQLQRMRSSSLLFSIFLPFVRTPFNIFRIGLRKTPLGTANVVYQLGKGVAGIKNGKPFSKTYLPAQQVKDLAEQAIAWGTMAAVYAAVQGDDDDEEKPFLITGSSPYSQISPGQAELQNRAYGGEYQIRVGGRSGIHFNYARYEPIATVLGTVTDMLRQFKNWKGGRSEMSEALDGAFGYFIAQAESKSFLRGISEMIKTAKTSQSASEFTKKLIGTAIVPNLIRQPLRNFDEFARDSKHAGLEYQIFPAGGMAEAKVDQYGRDVRKDGGSLFRLIFPVGVEPDEKLVPADALLINWNRSNPGTSWAPAPPQDTYKVKDENRKMTADEYRRYSILAGRLAANRLAGKFTPLQIRSPKEADVELIKKTFRDARKEIKDRMFAGRK